MENILPKIEFLTDKGRVRKNNEDNLWASDKGYNGITSLSVFVIADGMGGHEGGEIASGIAVEYIKNIFEADIADRSERSPEFLEYMDNDEYLKLFLTETVREINNLIYENNRKKDIKESMGTTIIFGVQKDDKIHMAHVGDSRAYLIRGRSIEQITVDHSYVAEHIDAGLLTEEEAINHPYHSVLTRSLGIDSSVEADIYTRRIKSDDYLVLCTDGLTNMVSDTDIRDVVAGGAANTCNKLIDLANGRGGVDNVSVIVAWFQGDALKDCDTQKLKRKVKNGGLSGLGGLRLAPLVLGFFALVLLLVMLWYMFSKHI
ncbi:MAG: Stp1/IreP family PP2C-type Ser/Thr phosphatase [Nitrospirae bacterium]|nr:Stp1/IreP family PP2C-type Ser/Thr phosphatase [Nitrospirota bacterium]